MIEPEFAENLNCLYDFFCTILLIAERDIFLANFDLILTELVSIQFLVLPGSKCSLYVSTFSTENRYVYRYRYILQMCSTVLDPSKIFFDGALLKQIELDRARPKQDMFRPCSI